MCRLAPGRMSRAGSMIEAEPAEAELRRVDLQRQTEPAGLGQWIGRLVVERDLQVDIRLVAVQDYACRDGGQVALGAAFHHGRHGDRRPLDAEPEILRRSGAVGEFLGGRLAELVEHRALDLLRTAEVRLAVFVHLLRVEPLVEVLAEADRSGVVDQLAARGLVHQRADDAARRIERGAEERGFDARLASAGRNRRSGPRPARRCDSPSAARRGR